MPRDVRFRRLPRRSATSCASAAPIERRRRSRRTGRPTSARARSTPSTARSCSCGARSLDEIGLFDEGYWMYMEDLDLCYRAAQRRLDHLVRAVRRGGPHQGRNKRASPAPSAQLCVPLRHVPLLPHAPRAEPKLALQCGRLQRHRHQVSHRCSRVGSRAAAKSFASSSRQTICRFRVVTPALSVDGSRS